MPNVFKSLFGGEASDYIWKPASELKVEDSEPVKPKKSAEPAQSAKSVEPPETAKAETVEAVAPEPPPEPTPETDPLGFARIQAEAILADARREAEQYKETARDEFAAELEKELEETRKAAREEGYSRGYAEGMAEAMQEGRLEREKMAREQIQGIEAFLEQAARERDRILDGAREELKDVAVAIAEKIIHVSLKNSGDIILRMVDAATETHKRCEWAHIYVSDSDVGGKAYTVPELTAALSHIAERVRVTPMPDEESGTCIVEMPDVILDASVSTQLENIKEVLDGVVLEDN